METENGKAEREGRLIINTVGAGIPNAFGIPLVGVYLVSQLGFTMVGVLVLVVYLYIIFVCMLCIFALPG